MSDPFRGLQAILGTDKKNPMFAVYRDAEKRELHVYYGFELLEVVPDDKSSPRFRLMVAQLYNAGVKGVKLVEVFGVDPKFMRRWGRALRSGDPEALVKALQGRGPRKLTPEIKAYIKRRFPILYEENPRNYSSRLRREILEIFNVQLSGEGLRLHFRQLKAERQNTEDPEQNLTSCEESPPGSTRSEPSEHSAVPGAGKAQQPCAKKGALAV